MSKKLRSSLFKYQSLTSPHTIENLQKRQIWYSKPEKLNDPFDCATPYLINLNVTEAEWQFAQKQLLRWTRDSLSKAEAEELKTRYFSEGKLNQKFRDDYHKIVLALIDKNPRTYEKIGVVCLSEEPDNILMWSHYSNGHRGICLEFDTNYFPFNDSLKVHRVQYKKNYPVIKLVSLISRTLLNLMPLLTKSIKWKYEKEWRLLHEQGDTPLKYDAKALKAIYFGCAMSNKDIEKVVTLPATSAPQLYRMKRSDREFKPEYEFYRPQWDSKYSQLRTWQFVIQNAGRPKRLVPLGFRLPQHDK